MKNDFSILLVEDDEDDQMLFMEAVNELDTGINCKCTSTAEGGLRVLRSSTGEKPDYIFLDLNLPMMNGLEFLEEVKASKELKTIPVIIFSTSTRESDREKAKQLGAVNFISKPHNYNELKNKLHDALNLIN